MAPLLLLKNAAAHVLRICTPLCLLLLLCWWAPLRAQVFEPGRSATGPALVLGNPATGGVGNASDAASSVVQTPHVRAELVAHAPEGWRAGAPLWLGLLLDHAPQWHTYWRNPGDSGLATELQWQLPAGMEAGEIDWPAPRKLRLQELANYGYEGQVLLPVPLRLTPDWQPGQDVQIQLEAQWLVCHLECIPEQGSFRLVLPADVATTAWAGAFAQAQRLRPASLSVQGQAAAVGERLQLRVQGLPAALQGQPLEVFAVQPQVLRHGARAGQQWQQRWEGDTWLADLPLSPDRGSAASGTALPLVITRLSRSEGGVWDPARMADEAGPVAWEITLPLGTGWEAPARGVPTPAFTTAAAAQQRGEPSQTAGALAPSSSTSAPLAASSQAPSLPPVPAPTAPSALALMLLLALLGGMVLNLMPCVFPVLAIKALALAQHGSDRRAQRVSAWAYAAGVVLSCLALGALVLALQAAGAQLGWGFQLQSPWFVASMALLFAVMGLALAGVVQLGLWLPERLRSAGAGTADAARSPVIESLGAGVLAVLVASPCTGPFLGAALGATLSLPPVAALAIFVAMGVGLALPFMVLALVPRWIDALPRPGAWMETFRNALAFPMFATVAWLLWVLAHQVGANAMVAWLFVLWAVSFVLWLWGKRPGRGAAGWRAVWVVWALTLAVPTVVMLAGGHYFGKTVAVQARAAQAPSPSTALASEDGPWQPWSLQAQQTALQQGRAVFVDFTASWCITCQYNKATALADAQVLADFERANVLLLRADWTRRNAAITQALHALGRTGVPTYALHVPGQPAQVMSEILDKVTLREALAAVR